MRNKGRGEERMDKTEINRKQKENDKYKKLEEALAVFLFKVCL